MSLDTFKHVSFLSSMSNLSSELRIPENFGKKFGKFLNQEVILSTDGEHRKCWKVKIKQSDGRFCFADGWLEFANDNKLSPLDHCVFALVQNSTIRVTMFGKGRVMKKPPSSLPPPCSTPDVVSNRRPKNPIECAIPISEDQTSESDDYSENEAGVTVMKGFTKVLNQQTLRVLIIPKAFAEKTGISRRSSINLKNKQRMRKRVKVLKAKNGWIYLGEQWKEFCHENNLTVGTKLTFVYDETTLVVIKTS